MLEKDLSLQKAYAPLVASTSVIVQLQLCLDTML